MAPPGLAVRLRFWPAHTGELMVMVGDAGIGLTTTLNVACGLVHPFSAWVTVYMPALSVDALERVKLGIAPLVANGVIQVNNVPTPEAPSIMSAPMQTLEVPVAVGAEGV